MSDIVSLPGLRDTINTLINVQGEIQFGLAHAVTVRAADALTEFRATSPQATGAMAGGWEIRPLGFAAIEVYNEVNRNGFSYPSAQATGTGQQGQTLVGFDGEFNTGWVGRKPNPTFRAAWERQASSPLAVGKLFSIG